MQGPITATGGQVVFTALPAATTEYLVTIEGIITSNGSAGTVNFQYASETTGTITVQAGSFVEYRRLA
jgi:hypothetical protein